MIKAENLRIGDLVRVCRNGWFPEGTVCIVTQINSERSYKENKGAVTLSRVHGTDNEPWGVWCSHIEGVTITPAILEKNGFDSKEPKKATPSILVVRKDTFADISISNAEVTDGWCLSRLEDFQILL